MKITTKKLLALLYSPDIYSPHYFAVKDITRLFSELSPGGRRSLIHWLKRQGLIEGVVNKKNESLFITETGQRQLLEEVPALRPAQAWDGQWRVILFKASPKGDPHFHYLRSEILKNGGLPINRGMYAFISEVPASLLHKCQLNYASSVAIGTMGNWVLGNLRDVAITYYGLHDLANMYSSISNEVSRLLIANNGKKGLNSSEIANYYSLYSRFAANLCEDSGLLHYFFPTLVSPRELLSDLQQLLLS